MNQKVLFIVIALAAFVVIFLVLTKILSDKSSKHAKKSLQRISRDELGEDVGGYVISDDSEERFAEKIRDVPFFGNIYTKLKQSGSGLSFSGYLAMLFVVAALVGALVWFISHQVLYAVGIGLLASVFYNYGYLNRKLEKRNDYFLNNFPDAIDMMVRSVKSGHPLISSMKLIAKNAEKPISTEFQRVVDEVSYGRPMPESLRKMADRIGLLDVNFFVVILSVQQETGGSLAEVLTNLSNIIRKRKQLRLKINALTAEGRLTTKIFAAIPLLQLLVVYSFSRDYLTPLFETSTGNTCLLIAASMIVASIFVTKKLTKMDI